MGEWRGLGGEIGQSAAEFLFGPVKPYLDEILVRSGHLGHFTDASAADLVEDVRLTDGFGQRRNGL